MKLRLLHRVWVIVLVICSMAVIPVWYFAEWELVYKGLFSVSIYLSGWVIAHYLFKDVNEGLAALEVGLLNLKDGEFSTTLVYQNDDELGKLCQLYNQTVEHLRLEKRWLYQRELLLDKVTQSSPEALFLVNDNQQIIFSNIAARRFFDVPTSLDGGELSQLLETAPSGVKSAIEAGKDGLFSINFSGQDNHQDSQTWHMASGNFVLNNQTHRLYILKQMTREISRQEVAVWKKVIRVISHELNNSLGPISSMLHSGRILSLKVDEDRLARVFSTIDERIKHLSEFVQGYGQFAKIPEPKVQLISSQALLKNLSDQWEFTYDISQDIPIYADPAQLEQLLINLLKNAHESGSPRQDIRIEIFTAPAMQETQIIVTDAGKGIAEGSLNSVLIPFYSTKSNGSGLGLALCREIIDAHHGQIVLSNRSTGGLIVRVTLPKFGTNAGV
ncbi:PAS domain-containing sensor histidine kinase [Glaciecola sp. SC05]|uniref:sensor histidine kinase n=1 Tax=Glaciecola sp. SC05 TaxID=1987355 RepID=UPI0035285F78